MYTWEYPGIYFRNSLLLHKSFKTFSYKILILWSFAFCILVFDTFGFHNKYFNVLPQQRSIIFPHEESVTLRPFFESSMISFPYQPWNHLYQLTVPYKYMHVSEYNILSQSLFSTNELRTNNSDYTCSETLLKWQFCLSVSNLYTSSCIREAFQNHVA